MTLYLKYATDKGKEGFNPELDEKIQKFFESEGFEFIGRGFNEITFERDFTFEKAEDASIAQTMPLITDNTGEL